MALYIINRLVNMLLTLWLIISFTFAVMHAVPGGPFASEKRVPEAVRHNLEARYHVDDPLWKQYIECLWRTACWDFGPSFRHDRTVNSIINESFPISAQLGVISLSIALVLGIPMGITSALQQNRWPDRLVTFFSLLGYSLPSFVIGGLLMYVLSFNLGWLPTAMWGDWRHLVMPVITLSMLPLAFITRLMRAGMIEVLRQDYIVVARAKGAGMRVVIGRHALKNAVLPVVTYLGPLSAQVLTGSFIVEYIFAVPGLGRYFVEGVANRDYTLIMGTTVFYSTVLLVANFLVDLIYITLNPRIKLHHDGGS